MTTTGQPQSFGARLRELAALQGDRPAATIVAVDGHETTATYAELNAWSTGIAALLHERGVGPASTVTIALGNTLAQLASCFGAWKLGACVIPLSTRALRHERDDLLQLLMPDAVIADWDDLPSISSEAIAGAKRRSAPEPADVIARPGKGIVSEGDTGSSKIIIDPGPWARVPGRSLVGVGDEVGFHTVGVQLVPGALHHNMGFLWSVAGLFEGQHVVVLGRFEPQLAVATIARHGVEFMALLPSMMRRIVELEPQVQPSLRSLTSVVHSAAFCTAAVKRAWIDLVGADVLYEVFGASENMGTTVVRGTEWLERPGTVGRPCETLLRILDGAGNEVGPGTVGEIFMRPTGRPQPTYTYLGADAARTDPDGYVSVGDLGWVDRDGYLYPADRRPDRIVTGGADVYPAEVEAALAEHPDVHEAAVIGVPDELWGERVHAVLELKQGKPPSQEDLDVWCRERIAAYKVPKAFEVVPALPRDDTGRVRRQLLAESRRS